MVKFKYLYCIILLAFVELTVSLIQNVTNKHDNKTDFRRSRKISKKERSTSSSGQVKDPGSVEDDKESLDLSYHDLTSVNSNEGKPVSSDERKGWRKWHRKCRNCKADMAKKWRDPTISWICGGYQRARRSFKSECMMEMRNCQDGTMFVKIYDHRCKDAKGKETPQGIHFFYDYKVRLSDDSSESSSNEVEEEESSDL